MQGSPCSPTPRSGPVRALIPSNVGSPPRQGRATSSTDRRRHIVTAAGLQAWRRQPAPSRSSSLGMGMQSTPGRTYGSSKPSKSIGTQSTPAKADDGQSSTSVSSASASAVRRIRPLGDLAHFDTTSSIESMPPSSLPSAFRRIEGIARPSSQFHSSRSRTVNSSIHSFTTESNHSEVTEYHDQTVPLNDAYLTTSAGHSQPTRYSHAGSSQHSTSRGRTPSNRGTAIKPTKTKETKKRMRGSPLDDVSDYSFFERPVPLQDDSVLTPTAAKLLLSRPTRLESLLFQPSPTPQVADPVTPPRRLQPARRRAPSIGGAWDTGVGREVPLSGPTSPSPVRATLMTPEGIPDVLEFPSSLRKAKKGRHSNSWDDVGGRVELPELDHEVAERRVPEDLLQSPDHIASDCSNQEAPSETRASDHAGADVSWDEGIVNDAAFAEEDRNATDNDESLNLTVPMWHDPWGFGYMQEWVRASSLSNNLLAISKRFKRGARNR
ncbi:uncharacterized protein LOC62_03G004223 [Vanrija pseudolonga]|uniref:Uncharacterized protein n=1 Tax=Vanrija pseudolonga TaxID=143232 RepID=A0AAF0Y5J7_9TREE|nr:hypothetical protein LOC62_03G004223 [Vanrija pseudolonga]